MTQTHPKETRYLKTRRHHNTLVVSRYGDAFLSQYGELATMVYGIKYTTVNVDRLRLRMRTPHCPYHPLTPSCMMAGLGVSNIHAVFTRGRIILVSSNRPQALGLIWVQESYQIGHNRRITL